MVLYCQEFWLCLPLPCDFSLVQGFYQVARKPVSSHIREVYNQISRCQLAELWGHGKCGEQVDCAQILPSFRAPHGTDLSHAVILGCGSPPTSRGGSKPPTDHDRQLKRPSKRMLLVGANCWLRAGYGQFMGNDGWFITIMACSSQQKTIQTMGS